MKILVLGGGSIRSSYQVGAVIGLLKKGYKPDAIYGISGGSLVALLLANFVGQQGVDKELIDWDLIADQMSYFWLNNITAPEDLVKKKKVLPLIYKIWKKEFDGIYSNKPLKNIINEKVSIENVYNSSITCFTGATSLRTGKIEYLNSKSHDFIKQCIASSSIPVVFPKENINNKMYVDGGIIHSAPLAPAFKLNPEEITCILTTPDDITDDYFNPGCIVEYVSRILEISLSNNLRKDIGRAKEINDLLEEFSTSNRLKEKKFVPLKIIRPHNMLEVKITSFITTDIEIMVNKGFNDALKS